MRIAGKRVTRTRLIESGRFVVAVDVEMVIPADDPSEPCYEAEKVELLKEVAAPAESGDRPWLLKHGRVYELVGAE
ncbi:MAG: hypothetical protein B7Z73_05955 [Planctomycetia bacterium 21-64-5]|nr:MAG: hypothetical protein B7Z73_05955 [Planctomycetia bacterium 21-64-5]HQU44251.1 hypothetical protein [Pirellulales bacterium]HVA49629.1 hypothetical protein [Pirellulales bacterium]